MRSATTAYGLRLAADMETLGRRYRVLGAQLKDAGEQVEYTNHPLDPKTVRIAEFALPGLLEFQADLLDRMDAPVADVVFLSIPASRVTRSTADGGMGEAGHHFLQRGGDRKYLVEQLLLGRDALRMIVNGALNETNAEGREATKAGALLLQVGTVLVGFADIIRSIG